MRDVSGVCLSVSVLSTKVCFLDREANHTMGAELPQVVFTLGHWGGRWEGH